MTAIGPVASSERSVTSSDQVRLLPVRVRLATGTSALRRECESFFVSVEVDCVEAVLVKRTHRTDGLV